MIKEIIISVSDEETRVAVLENGIPVEFYIERPVTQRLVGNIYKGRVENVLPGMQAAFVDIGMEKNAFLYVEDAIPQTAIEGRSQNEIQIVNISDIVKKGKEIVVQIVKEPIGTKGPRVTTHITLPGRYLVLMPNADYIGISRRIEDERERERLKELAAEIKPANMGVIVRTVAEGIGQEELSQDSGILNKMWNKVASRCAYSAAPDLLHRDIELIQRIMRDIFTDDVDKLTINSRPEYEKVMDLLDITDRKSKTKIFFDDRENIFSDLGIEPELEKALRRKVWLKCGGHIVIDQAEALTAIDVNTGKFVGSKNLEDTVLRTNLDAAVEIAHQLRLRNIGGIIIIDFIDMQEEENQKQVLAALEEETKKDKTKINILGLTQLGLVEMTRKKVRPSLSEVMQKSCPYCEGKGKVLSEETVGIQFKKLIYSLALQTPAENILVEANPLVASKLIGSGGVNLRELEQKTGKTFHIRGSLGKHIESVNISPLNSREEIDSVIIPVRQGQILEVVIEDPHNINHKDGIARLDGFVLDIEGGGNLIGETVPIEVSAVYRTYAKARIISSL
ncbi:MAG: Rne/Rng family ribonuclease [Peptococcaceae bacterium]|nr:Rne/Rng family ribonuclease [Peptococcaceae bacterium]